ncbi:MAG: phenylalanine--tRNA ligase subunit beta, partial [Alphaproteobacteria bacterium]|nr:phenylalanine--tRNA ligase subunit beta [Alphaproteobacteria bacterium]
DPHWLQAERPYDVFDVKSDVLQVFQAFHLTPEQVQVVPQAPSYYHPKRCGTFKQGNKILAYFGELHPKVLKQLDIKSPCMGFEVLLDHLPHKKAKPQKGACFSPYQPVHRDFAFVMDDQTPVQDLIKCIQKVDPKHIQDIAVFDVYAGDKLPVGKKSIALRIKIQSKDTTLTDGVLAEMQQKIIESAAKMNAVIRDGKADMTVSS